MCNNFREHVAEHRSTAVGQAHEPGALVLGTAFAQHQAFLLEPLDDAGQRALGDQGALPQLLVAHATGVAERGDDVELRMRQAILPYRFARIPFEALQALGQQPDAR
jgi:hypothetical protein